ncbi:MAG: ABC transporter permease [Mycobacterium sp.]|jgi:peptide/nickel transport system permease protein
MSTPIPVRPWLLTVRRILVQPQTRIGFFLTMLVCAFALIGPLLAAHSPTEFVATPYHLPTGDAWLGTDALGRDVLSRLMFGGWSVVWMSVAATVLGVGGGIILGLLAGYVRGATDGLIMRALDVVLALPQLVLVLLFVSLIGPKLWLIVLMTAVAWVPGVARTTRGMTLDISEREFVQAAEVLGVSRWSILFREILPNLTTPLFVEFALRLTWSIALIAGLSFIGLGIQPPAADWGLMINENRNGLATQPWGVLGPITLIALFTIGTNLLAEGVSRTIAGVDRPGGST